MCQQWLKHLCWWADKTARADFNVVYRLNIWLLHSTVKVAKDNLSRKQNTHWLSEVLRKSIINQTWSNTHKKTWHGFWICAGWSKILGQGFTVKVDKLEPKRAAQISAIKDVKEQHKYQGKNKMWQTKVCVQFLFFKDKACLIRR